MKHFILVLFVILAASHTHAQTFSELLQNGKDIIKAERDKYAGQVADFKPAIQVLEQAVKLQPENPEAHYFLGSAYDYDNSPDGSKMIYTNRDKALMASREFEKVIELSPKYTGDIIALDPYSKLSSIWGSLGYAYIVRNGHDSARWAFREGKKHGAFSDFALSYYKQVLLNCSKDAILLCTGDFSTMNIWYQQEMGKVRTDVTVVSSTLLQIPWYTAFLYKNDPSLFSSEKIATDTTLIMKWEAKTIEIPIKNTGEKFQWLVKPTYKEEVVFRQDMVFMDIFTHNKFNRTIYLTKYTQAESIPGLDDHVKDCDISDMIVPDKNPERGKEFYDCLNTFPYDMLQTINMSNGLEATDEYTLRAGFLTGIYQLLKDSKEEEAKKLYAQLIKYLPVSRFPCENDQIEKYMDFFKKHFGY